ncbi:MAG: lycopene cyclase domain-containing protein [Candidatus Poribacteria bacterium]|nr:lycopene cyclase domain-containing protein [Candidatus Poribacteria bacterium]
MKFEYLLFNLAVVVGPVVSQFSRQIKSVSRWRLKLLVSVIVMIPYVIWDALVAGSHWQFNTAYTLDFRLFGLPIEEWLFFITVPFGCLLVWETLPQLDRWLARLKSLRHIRNVLYATLPVGIWVFSTGKQYTGLVLCCFGLVGLVDMLLRTDLLLRPKTYLYLAIVAGLILVFNGYLTARPVVIYGEAYQMGYRIWTIPIEDFGYGFTLMLFNTMLYEKLKNGK